MATKDWVESGKDRVGAVSNRGAGGPEELLLERESELGVFEGYLERASEARGALVLLEGEPGIGKTALIGVARQLARGQGMNVLSARGHELETAFAFGVVRQLFERELMRADGDLLAGAAQLARPLFEQGEVLADAPEGPIDANFPILHGLYWLVENIAQRAPLLLAVDDLQWADGPSLRFLQYLASRLDDVPVLVVAGTRSGDAQPAAVQQLISTEAAERIKLEALSHEAVGQVVELRLGAPADQPFVTACFSATRGNPFLVSELVAEFAEVGVPPTAANTEHLGRLAPKAGSAAISRRLGKLSDEAVGLAEAVAVLGEDLPLRDAAAFSGLDEDSAAHAAAVLADARVFERDLPVRFAHPLIRDALYGALTGPERDAAHRRAAALLRQAGVGPERVGSHLLRTEPARQAGTVEVLREAAAGAVTRGAPDAAIPYLRRALAEPAEGEARLALLQMLVYASVRAGMFEVVAEVDADLAALLEHDELMINSAPHLCLMMYLSGQGERAAALSQRAIDAAIRNDTYDVVMVLEGQGALFGNWDARLAERLQLHKDKCPPGSKADYLRHVLLASRLGKEGSSRTECTAAAMAAAELRRRFTDDALPHAFCLTMEALLYCEEYDAVDAALEAELADARARGAWLEVAAANNFAAVALQTRGRLQDALAANREAVELIRRFNPIFLHPIYVAQLAFSLAALGELEEAEREMASIDFSGRMGIPLHLRAQLRLAQGRPDEALEDLFEVGKFKRERNWNNPSLVPWASTAARILAARGENERACELAQQELDSARRWGAPTAIGVALVGWGLAVGGDDGLDYLRAACEQLAGSEAKLEYAAALVELGSALRRANQRAEARGPLRQALELSRGCRAAPLAERAEAELVATGERLELARRFSTGPDALTPSERRVAGLAAEGLTNRQIAEALFVSTKTIETHLSHIFQKLDIGSRRDVGEALQVVPA